LSLDWPTDGKAHSDDLCAIDSVTRAQTRLGPGLAADLDPAWSPDGTQLAVTWSTPFESRIDLVAADGSRRLHLTPGPLERQPSWAPDGNRLAFSSSGDIYAMNVDGTNRVRLTDHPAADFNPAWSPDGARIAFATERDNNDPRFSRPEIYVMTADGTGETNLTRYAGYDNAPSWSPDGSRILFESVRNGNRDIYVMNADGTNQERLTDDPAEDTTPASSPDGVRVAFVRSSDVYVMERRRQQRDKPDANADERKHSRLAADRVVVPLVAPAEPALCDRRHGRR
jgi:Tol biopolymer transport system component